MHRQVQYTLTTECKWHTCSVVPACESISSTCAYQSRALWVHAFALKWAHKYLRLDDKSLTSLKASYTFVASLRSTGFSKKIACLCVWKCSWSYSWALKTLTWKRQRIRSLSTPSKSFTVSLHSANWLVFIKKYDRCASCLLSRSCHRCLFSEIFGPYLLYSQVYARAFVCARVCPACEHQACASRLLSYGINLYCVNVCGGMGWVHCWYRPDPLE